MGKRGGRALAEVLDGPIAVDERGGVRRGRGGIGVKPMTTPLLLMPLA